MEKTLGHSDFPEGYGKVSLHIDDIPKLKLILLNYRKYGDRVSFAFAIRLLQAEKVYGSKQNVLHELDYLEGIELKSHTKPATQFKRAPLNIFWHKHVVSPYHFLGNFGAEWGLNYPDTKNRRFTNVVNEIAKQHEGETGTWIAPLIDKLTQAPLDRKAESRATGDWIIFSKYKDKNYYLDLATHEEDDQTLFEKIKVGCGNEFPFLF